MKYLLLITLIIIVLLLIISKGRNNQYEYFTNIQYELPKIMWSYWDTEKLPETVKLIYENRVRKMPGWKHICLNANTVSDYIDISSPPEGFDKLIIQHKTDYYRLLLLEKYGGVWIDISIIVNDPNEIDKLYDEAVSKKSEFTGFILNQDADRTKYIENWFIMAPKNSGLIREWLKEFVSAIRMGFDNYIPSAKSEGVLLVNPINPYLTQHACMQTVLQKRLNRTPNIILKDAEKNMFKLQVDCNWDNQCLFDKFINEPGEVHKIPYIKLRGGDREFNIKQYFLVTEGFGNRVGYAA